MDVNAFYGILAGLSFTLLGLWWVACQTRMGWLIDRVGRGMAYAVSLRFVLPGAMSLLSLVAPDVPVLWRVTLPGQIDELWIIDVEGAIVIIDAMYRPDTPTELIEEMRSIVESATFELP